MSQVWRDLAAAVACRIEFERRCQRLRLVDEFTVVRFAAEFLATQFTCKIAVDVPHPNLSGKFIDLVGTHPSNNQIELGLEAKWLRPSNAGRDWLQEVTLDLFRLQHLRRDCTPGAERVLLVAGTREMIREKLFEQNVHTGSKNTLGLPFVLPTLLSATPSKIKIRDVDEKGRKWLKRCHNQLGDGLPISYEAQLAARFCCCDDDHSSEAVVWVTHRKQNWQSFDATNAWSS